MEKKLSEDVKYFQEKKQYIERIEEFENFKKLELEKIIRDETEKYEQTIEALKDILKDYKTEYEKAGEVEINLSIGELVEELSNLTGKNVSDVKVKVRTVHRTYYGERDVDDFRNLIAQHPESGCTLLVDLDLRGATFYHYEFVYRNIDLDEIQSDGKTFLEHCSAETHYEESQYTTLVVDKNVMDLNLKLNLKQLIDDDSSSFYPSSLIRQAVLNCVDRQNIEKEQPNSKTKKMSKN